MSTPSFHRPQNNDRITGPEESLPSLAARRALATVATLPEGCHCRTRLPVKLTSRDAGAVVSRKRSALRNVIDIQNCPRHATIACFYMMTQTILSAATPASPEPQGPALNECVSAPSAKHPEPHLDAGLVAQALLFTQRYEGPVRSCRSKREEQAHAAASLSAEILIANLELEFQLTYRKLSPLGISNRKFSPLLRLRFSSPPRSPSANESSDTRHSSLCVLIYGSPIKSRRNPFENSNLQISNRR